jgi:shikimate kinase
MKLSLIGMSGSGKTYWAQKLEEVGYTRFTIDDIIEAKLGDELKKNGFSGIHDLAKWLGQPYEPQYQEHSDRYVDLEIEAMDEVFEKVSAMKESDKVIIDTTGSVIYHGAATLHTLETLTKVIYLDTPDEVKDEMYEKYKKDPRPVIWGKSFYRIGDETNEAALARCYPELLSNRAKKYERHAHVTLDYHLLRSELFTTEMFLNQVIQP